MEMNFIHQLTLFLGKGPLSHIGEEAEQAPQSISYVEAKRKIITFSDKYCNHL
jgi:hypothetical protein